MHASFCRYAQPLVTPILSFAALDFIRQHQASIRPIPGRLSPVDSLYGLTFPSGFPLWAYQYIQDWNRSGFLRHLSSPDGSAIDTALLIITNNFLKWVIAMSTPNLIITDSYLVQISFTWKQNWAPLVFDYGLSFLP